MKTQLKQGQVLELTFTEGKRKIPIAHAPDGRICLLNFKTKNQYVRAGEMWKCKIDQIHKNKIIVSTIEMLCTAEMTQQLMQYKTQKLINKFHKT